MPIASQPFDSVDMNALPLETEPLRMVIGNEEFALYLSDKHREELDSVLEKFTANEESRPFARTINPVRSTTRRKSAGESATDWFERMGHPNDREHFMSWADENGLSLAKQGQVSQAFRTAYEEAHDM